MKELKVTFENEPSPEAIKNAWRVIAKSISRRMGCTVVPVFKDEVENQKEQWNDIYLTTRTSNSQSHKMA